MADEKNADEQTKSNALKEEQGLVFSREIETEMKSCYIDYAMSVIVGRAIPDVRDGLKPVHRRILYSMNELGVFHNKPYKKCARIVGDCMGKYHPHGDSAIYDTLVRMAQDFSLRYPLVDGQGNFGSIDGDSAAAMRYTEARLGRIAGELLSDIDKETVDFVENFDGSLKEPSVLPSKIPNLIINGSSGIAVGMATNIPPHNIKETCLAVSALIDNPDMGNDELVKIIPGPDFPTGGEIVGRNGILHAMNTGRGRVVVRGKMELEDKGKRRRLIIKEIPYMLNKTSLIEQLASAIKDKKIEGVVDIRDESNREGIRIALDLKADANEEIIRNQIEKNSSYQTTFGINTVVLVNNRPMTLGIREVLLYFIEHRENVVRRKTIFDLNKAKEKEHVLKGLLIALENLDKTIELIKNSKSVQDAKQALFENFSLSDIQATAILQMRLQRITALEQDKVKNDYKETVELIKTLEEILSSRINILKIIKEELSEIIQKYGDDRKTNILDSEQIDLEIEDLIEETDVIITITKNGYIKRLSPDEYRTQKRGGKGITATTTTEEDLVKDIFKTTTHSYLLIFTNKGRVHWIKAYQVPESSRYAKGKAIINLVELSLDEKVSAVLPIREIEQEGYLVFATKKGFIKKTALSNFANPRKGGIIAISLKEDDNLVDVIKTDGASQLILCSKEGYAIRFFEKTIRPTGRSSMGVIGMRLRKNDQIVGAIVCDESHEILTISEKGYGKRTPSLKYRLTGRGGKGVINMKVNEKTGKIAYAIPVLENDEIIVVTNNGTAIRTKVLDISTVGRNSQGVRIIRLSEDDFVVSFAKIDQNGISEPNP
ncbi:MAG TPA: DNA gyrase subunit A [Candidatus Woesearchaeota archaeon]|nr:DNA gyrase subunit A [Candidatus Woesearchaeota archaeon]